MLLQGIHFCPMHVSSKRVDWHPKLERKAARNGLKLFSK
jgi:hypothetical protein